jgi:hypothetical protein
LLEVCNAREGGDGWEVEVGEAHDCRSELRLGGRYSCQTISKYFSIESNRSWSMKVGVCEWFLFGVARRSCDNRRHRAHFYTASCDDHSVLQLALASIIAVP